MEAMKMETRVTAPKSGRIHHTVEAGSSVGAGTPIATIE
jgi:acetyl-CoA/propionyl-CoA carboxylase biotin carboxyl carrier protein